MWFLRKTDCLSVVSVLVFLFSCEGQGVLPLSSLSFFLPLCSIRGKYDSWYSGFKSFDKLRK